MKSETIGRKKVKPQTNKGKKGKKQIISKSKSHQNIQIHIDLSKRKGATKSFPSSSNTNRQPIINLPPPIYGMSAPSQSSSSMNEALNVLLANHLGYEKAHRNEVKKENPITKDEESITSFGDTLNKSFAGPEDKSVGFDYPEEEEFNAENPDLEYSTLWSSSMKKVEKEEQEEMRRPSLRNTMVPNIELSRMKLNELQELAISRGIDIHKEDSQISQGKGKGYKPNKNRQQLIEELTRL